MDSWSFRLFVFLSGSPVVLGTLIVVWLIYLPLLYWARKKDKYLSKEIVFRLADNHPADHYQYFVQIVVGKQMITKRPSRLFLKIFGEKSMSSTHLLCANYVSRSRTERDSGRFVLTTPIDLGDLHHIRIWHDVYEEQPQWFLRECIIKDMQRGRTYHFVYNNWLGLDTPQNSLFTIKIQVNNSAAVKLSSKMWRDMYHKHMLLGIFSNISNVSFTYLQKVICSLVFILMLMMLNIPLIGVPNEFISNYYDTSEYRVSSKLFLVGLLNGTIVFTLNLLLNLLFAAADPSIPKINCKVLQDIVRNLPTKLDMKSKTHVSTDTRDVYKPLTDSIIQPLKSRLETSSSEEETSLSEVNISSKKVDWNSVQREKKRRYSFKMTRKSRISFEDRNARFSHSLEDVKPAITRARVSLSWTNLVGDRGQSQIVQNHLGVSNNDILYGQGDITSTRQNDLETTSMDTNSNAVQDGGIFAHLSPKITRCVQDSCIGAGSEASAKVDSGRFQTFKALDEYTEKIRCEQFGLVEDPETKDMPNMLNNCRLPWWSAIIAWIWSISIIFTATYYILLHGTLFGKEDSFIWITCLVVALVYTMTILEPLKIIVMIKVSTSNNRTYSRIQNLNAEFIEHRNYYDKMKSYGLKLAAPAMWIKTLIMPWKSKAFDQTIYLRKFSQKIHKMTGGIVLYISLLLILLTISYGDTDIENSFRVKQVAEHMFVDARYNGNVPLNKVRTSEDMVEYLKTIVMGNLFVKTEYGYITSSLVSCLIGNIHIRQKRVRSGFCDAESLKRIIGEFECRAPFSENEEDQASYNTSWSTLDRKKHSNKTAWTFQSNDYLQSFHHGADRTSFTVESL
ncbi:hypothetical protein ScPMuIL_001520 [Solemya velum]